MGAPWKASRGALGGRRLSLVTHESPLTGQRSFPFSVFYSPFLAAALPVILFRLLRRYPLLFPTSSRTRPVTALNWFSHFPQNPSWEKNSGPLRPSKSFAVL